MAVAPRRMTGVHVEKLARTPGRHTLGDGLLMQVRASTRPGQSPRAQFLFRFQLRGTRRELGLGPVGPVTLAEARERLFEARRLIARGVDPVAQRHAEAQEAESSVNGTFDAVAAAYIEDNKVGWKAKADQAWRMTLASYASPVIGSTQCRDVTPDDIVAILRPIWTEKNATAVKLARRLAVLFDYAKAKGVGGDSNPAQWRSNLALRLPKPSQVHTVEHRAAIPHEELRKVMGKLKNAQGMAAKAVRFAALTAQRATATTNASWSDIDLATKTWTIPSQFSKTRRPLRVALSPQAIEVLKEVEPLREQSELVFPGGRVGRPLSLTALMKALREAGGGDATTHGLRASFKSWASEMGENREAAEHALGHLVGSAVERAYQRSDLLDLRRPLMAKWGKHIAR